MPSMSHTLFAGLIDYAGLFPPARLPMDEAFARFLAHRRGRDGWLLAHFVCPAPRLAELAPLIRGSDLGETPVRIATLGAGGDDPPSYAASLEDDVESMSILARGVGDRVKLGVFEVKLPADGDPAEVVDVTLHHLEELEPAAPMPFFEIPLVGDTPAPAAVAEAVASASHEIDPGRRAGLKIRCGGLEAAAVPSVKAVADAVIAAREAGLPLKATQGLHHPVRRPDPGLGVATHGFLNLAASILLGREHRLDADSTRTILAEEDPGAFILTETEISWRDLTADAGAASAARSDAFVSFGSCSFSEPKDDLAAFGWLERISQS